MAQLMAAFVGGMIVGVTLGIRLTFHALKRGLRRAGLLADEDEDRAGEREKRWYGAQFGSGAAKFQGATYKN
jgi:hypothetical protein